ncbi:MAG: S-layer homology domain-containing protein [Actinobacteria bacterium]|nr:S-layer homology domain-containing protein [Actinomycetota bacterium]
MPSWAKRYLAIAVREKLVTGYPDDTLLPNKNATRAEVAKLLSGVIRR